mgnify:CR=1 FL=1
MYYIGSYKSLTWVEKATDNLEHGGFRLVTRKLDVVFLEFYRSPPPNDNIGMILGEGIASSFQM